MNQPVLLSCLAWVSAAVVAAGGLLGAWSVNGDPDMRAFIFMAEGLTLLMLLAASWQIRQVVMARAAWPWQRQVASLCTLSLLLCTGGDVINFNLPQTLYRHGAVVRYDHLADSVWCFAPGYLLLLAAVLRVVHQRGVPLRAVAWAMSVACVLGLLSFASMHLPGTGAYVTALTGVYSMVITAVGFSAVLLLMAWGGRHAPASVCWVGLGLVLAAVADAVIGQFWLYGNGGKGFFPVVRDVNWVIYIGSQCLVIHLPRLLAPFTPPASGAR